MRKPLLFLLGLFGTCAAAQAQQRDPSFHNAQFRSGTAAGAVGSVVRQADGKYLVTGSFTTVDGHPTSGVARLLPDGTPDVSFSGLLPNAGRMAVQPDGRVLVYTGAARPIVRLLPDGLPDPTFVMDTSAALGTHLRRVCSAIIVQPDGRIVVAGAQTLARLNSNGSRDASFQAPALAADMLVCSVSLEPTGGLTYVTNYYDQESTIARLTATGAPDAGFTTRVLNQSTTNFMLRQADGRYLLSGIFGSNGSRPLGLCRLLPNGTLDSSLVAGPVGTTVTTTFRTGAVVAVAVQADGRILAAGAGATVRGYSGGLVSLVRCLPDGQDDTSFDDNYFYTLKSVAGFAYNGARVVELLTEPNGKTMVAGSFEQVGGQPSSGLTRLLAAQPLAAQPLATTPARETTVQLWPNPAHEQLWLRFDGSAPPRQVTLLDAVGRPVVSAAGAPALTLRTAGLARGLYVLRLDYDGRTVAQRVVLE
jgi:uncharacterized delta-60 repeat protein